MNYTSSIGIQQNVLAMPVPESTMRDLEFIHEDNWTRTPR
jgi:hypothetical protein